MNKKELKAALSNFNMTAGAQLKYYIIKSLYPNIRPSEIEEIGGFNSRTFPAIRKGVEEKGLESLLSTPSEKIKVVEIESAELVLLKEENEKLKKDLERKNHIIRLEEQTINSYENKIANLKDFIRKSAANRESVTQYCQQAIKKLQDQGIEMAPIPLDPYKKEMEELLE